MTLSEVISYKMASEMTEEPAELKGLEILPDLIEINPTGEEEETEMFVSRAKLYIWKDECLNNFWLYYGPNRIWPRKNSSDATKLECQVFRKNNSLSCCLNCDT